MTTTLETDTSLIAFGQRGSDPVVLKVVKQAGDEWNAGGVLRDFDGRGMVRAIAHTGGAMLLERLTPGHSLVQHSIEGRDDEAAMILARVIAAMSTGTTRRDLTTVAQLGEGFERYERGRDTRISPQLVSAARETYARLVGSQRETRLLHGDLQHSNVVFDRTRGWVAIDPKGVVGEVEYEIAASLRNPPESAGLFANPAIIARRVDIFAAELRLSRERVLAWAFAQSVLSAIWSVEDGGVVDANNPSLLLAEACYPMIA